MNSAHISSDDMTRYQKGMILDPDDIVAIEAHLWWCQECMEQVHHLEVMSLATPARPVRRLRLVELPAKAKSGPARPAK